LPPHVEKWGGGAIAPLASPVPPPMADALFLCGS